MPVRSSLKRGYRNRLVRHAGSRIHARPATINSGISHVTQEYEYKRAVEIGKKRLRLFAEIQNAAHPPALRAVLHLRIGHQQSAERGGEKNHRHEADSLR